MQSPTELRQTITASIIDALTKSDLPPWRQPWINDPNAPGLHTSMSTHNPYRGINQLLLQIAAMKNGFKSKWWGTFHQIKQQDASVSKGQKGVHDVLFKKFEKERTNESGELVKDDVMIMRSFCVWNAEQTTGLEKFRLGFIESQNDSTYRFEQADELIESIGADIRYGGNSAFYNPSSDFLQLPYRSQFETPEAFYETTFHELVHFTEHPSRLNWDRENEGYAMGELIAELGLPVTTNLSNHAAYLKSWLNGMSGDPKFIFRAAAQASKAVNYLLSFSRNTVQEAVEIEELVAA